MSHSNLIIFVITPLMLSIGVVSLLSFDDVFAVSKHEVICIDKVWIESTKGKIACVTPSTAEKLVERGWGTLLDEEPFEEKPVMEEPSDEIEIPPYPDQPPINPDLLATNDYSLPPPATKTNEVASRDSRKSSL